MKKIAVLMTVHNRRDTTVECLKRLYQQNNIEDINLDVYLTDDGCTDGTSEAVKGCFPKVNIIKGDGSLFWNRGMYVAWKEAAKKNYDFFLWLNDDTLLFQNALETIFRVGKTKDNNVIVVGSICAPDDHNRITYGGRGKKGLIHPYGEIKAVNNFNGNVVLIPSSVFKTLGYNDPFFSHAFGDSDYGMRALENGIGSFITDNFVGTCDRHDGSRKCWDPQCDIITRFKYLYSPLGYPPNEVFYYYNKHWGLMRAIKEYFHCQLKTLFPFIKLSH